MDYRVRLGNFETTPEMALQVGAVLGSGRLSYGKNSAELEDRVAKMHGAQYGLVSNSGTDSLRIALHALKIINKWNDGDEVMVPATTFVATINVVYQVGLKPVLVDVDETLCINPALIPEKLSEDTVAIMPVHLFGQVADMDSICDIAQDYDLAIVEDSCESIGLQSIHSDCTDVTCFSMYMAHILTAGVGGIAITNNKHIDEVMRSLLNHGRDPSYTQIDARVEPEKKFRFLHKGYSSRITEMESALAVAQLDGIHDNITYRNVIHGLLTKFIIRKNIPIIIPPLRHSSACMMYPIVVAAGDKPERNDLMSHMDKCGVEVRAAMPILDQEAYDFPRGEYPVSENLISNGLYLPCHQAMTEEDCIYIADALESYFD